ncbi:MAG: class I SAM-dependent methyltransferase [Eubacteriales bacterium]
MAPVTLDNRLLAAANYVRQGAYFADIGTDHAYLPVYLCQQGMLSAALATDIAEGPCRRAVRTVEAAGLSGCVQVLQTDGLEGLANRGLTDIAICGMGGELIADILDRAPFVRDPAVRLVLLPMSRAAVLRRYLAAQGFDIQSESLAQAGRKLYACLCVHYTGQCQTLTPVEAELGPYHLTRTPKDPLFPLLVRQTLQRTKRRVAGRLAGGLDTTADAALADALSEVLHDSSHAL